MYNLIYLFFVVFIYFLVHFYIYEQNYLGIKIAVTTIFIIHFFSYLLTIIANPGIPDRKYYSKNYIQNIKKGEESKYDKCKICNIITPKELNVSHCYYCDVCVIDQDHHCSFLGKCIGKNNCILFYVAIITIPLFLVMCFITLISYVIFIENEKRLIRKLGKKRN